MAEAAQPISCTANGSEAWFSRLSFRNQAKLGVRGALFLYASLVLCPIRIMVPDKTIDNTWYFALNYAAAHHLVLGRDIAWTWGPLAYLLLPFDIANNLARGLAFQACLWVLVVAVLWDLFFRGFFRVRNLAVFSILIGLSTFDYYQWQYAGNLLLYPALILLVHFRMRGGIVRYVAALALMGLMPLIQIFGTMIVGGVLAGLIVDLLVVDGRGLRLRLILALTVPAAVAIVCARMALDSYRAIAHYVAWNLELTRGYSIAMSTPGPRMALLAAFGAIALLVVAIFLMMLRDRQKPQFFVFILVIPVLMNFKHGFVRQDAPHVAGFFCFLALALALIMLGIPLDRSIPSAGTAIVVLFLFALLWQACAASGYLKNTIASITGIATPLRVWNASHFDVEARGGYSAETRIEPEIKLILGRDPVAFLSNVYSNAVVENLNLVLFPVFQRYSAYTPLLDQLDAVWVEKKGPPFLIFDGSAIDGRHPWTECPATWTAVYRWYNTRTLGSHNLLLERRMKPRFTHFEPLVLQTARLGEDLTLPASRDAVFWTIQCRLSRTGRIKELLGRVPPVMMDIYGKDGRSQTFRVLLPVLGAPSLGNYLPSSLTDFAELFSERDDRDFFVTKIEFRSSGRAAYNQDCQIEFFRALP